MEKSPTRARGAGLAIPHEPQLGSVGRSSAVAAAAAGAAAAATEIEWRREEVASLTREVKALRDRNTLLDDQLKDAEQAERAGRCSPVHRSSSDSLNDLSALTVAGKSTSFRPIDQSWTSTGDSVLHHGGQSWREECHSLQAQIASLEDRHRNLEMERAAAVSHDNPLYKIAAATGREDTSLLLVSSECEALRERLRNEEVVCLTLERRAIEVECHLDKARADMNSCGRSPDVVVDEQCPSRLAREAQELRARLGIWRGEITERKSQEQKVEDALHHQSHILNLSKSEQCALEGARAKLIAKIAALSEKRTVLRQSCQDADDAIVRLREENLKDVSSEVESLRGQSRNSERQLDAMIAKLATSSQAVTESANDNDQLNWKVSSLRKARDDLLRRVEDENTCSGNRLAALKAQCAVSTNAVADLRAMLDSALGDLWALRGEYAERLQRLQAAASASQEQRLRLAEGGQRLASLAREMNGRSETLAKALQEERRHGDALRRDLSAASEVALHTGTKAEPRDRPTRSAASSLPAGRRLSRRTAWRETGRENLDPRPNSAGYGGVVGPLMKPEA